MKNILRSLLMGFLWILLPLQGFPGRAQDPEAKKHTLMMERVQKSERRMEFYGKVIDQFDHPVEGACVTIQMDVFNPLNVVYFGLGIKEIKVKTNARGEFTCKKRGLSLFISDVKRNGYEYDRHRAIAEKSNSADYDEGQIPKASNPATPAIFHMRKLGEQTFLFQGGGGIGFKTRESGKEKGYDVIRHERVVGECLTTGQFLGNPIVPDLKVKALWNENEQTWTLELSAGTPGGGLLVVDHKLYEAPAEGYQPSYTFKVKVPKDLNRERPTVILPGNPPREVRLTNETPAPDNQVLHLYLRTREPWIYTRIEWPFPRNEPNDIAKDWICLWGGTILGDFSISVNPYGERNLEEAQGLPIDIKLMLAEQVRESFRYHPNGRPPKPDLVKLTQEWKAKQSLGEKAKGLFR